MQHKPTTKTELRERRRTRVRAVVRGTAERPRLVVFRSNRFLSAELIDDAVGRTLAAAHGRTAGGSQAAQAAAVGSAIAKAAKAKRIHQVVFDRAGYRYSGNIRALAEAARAGGLAF